jgi:V/A-type H+-transporting ATPase subunit F
MDGKVAVLGNSDFVMPFSAMGLDTYPVGTRQEVTEAAQQILEGKYALVVVAENVAKTADAVFETVHKEPVPGIIVVPFTTQPEGFATRALSDVLKRATGIDILQND